MNRRLFIMILFLLCRPAELKDKLDQGTEIYILGGKQYVGIALSQQKADLVKIVAKHKLKVMRIAKIEFANADNLGAKHDYKLICWEFICDS